MGKADKLFLLFIVIAVAVISLLPQNLNKTYEYLEFLRLYGGILLMFIFPLATYLKFRSKTL